MTDDPSSPNGFAAAGRGQSVVRKAEVGRRKWESKCIEPKCREHRPKLIARVGLIELIA
jgi:hypothetical protein